jgi:hypothetical protein
MTENKEGGFKEKLLGVPPEQYGDSYRQHVIEIYRTYLEMADRISARRENANSFFLTLNTAVVGFVGYLVGTDKLASYDSELSLIGIAGVLLSYLWYRIIRSYRGLNSAKFKVVHEIERFLPLRPYDAEWEFVGRGKNPKLYLPFTHVEIAIPWIFLTLHMIALMRVVPWRKVFQMIAGTAT